MLRFLRPFTAALAVSAALSTPALAQTFDFESTALGTATPFAAMAGGLTASFAAQSVTRPDAYQVGDATGLFVTLMNHMLYDPSTGPGVPLLVTFSHPLTSVSLNFATAQPNGPFSAVTLAAFLGGTAVGSSTATGFPPQGSDFPEGVLSFSGATFDRFVITETTQAPLAVDNIMVVQAPVGTVVPEPTTIALVGAGLAFAGLGATRRRRTVVTA